MSQPHAEVDDEGPGLLARERRHVLAGVPRVDWMGLSAPFVRSALLFGPRRGLYRPTMALQTIQRMGPVRHALAQRAVCGIVEVHAPFVDAPKK